MRYLVDTDILVDVGRNNQGAIDYVDVLRDWSASIVTGMELVAGAKDDQEVREIELILNSYRLIPVSEDGSRLAYNLMKEYAKSHGLDPTDALIAATAISEGLTLSTRNRRHFGAIGGLEIEVPEYEP